jgi:arylsulfate sulfotransferase
MEPCVTHIVLPDLISKQSASEKAMLEEFHSGEYTAQNPLVKFNPYLINPCAAVVLFRTSIPEIITVTVKGKTMSADIAHTFPPASVHILPILGLYPEYNNTIDIHIYQGITVTIQIKTGSAEDVAELISIKASPEYLRDKLIVTIPSGYGKFTGFDHQGDIRFNLSESIQLGVKRLKNGRFLFGSDRLVRLPYYATGLYEMDLVGKVYAEYSVPGGYHHDEIELPGGDFVVLTGGPDNETVEDICALINRRTGEVERTWDLKDVLTPGEGSSGCATKADWIHANSIIYDEKTNSLMISARHLDAIINMDFDSGKLNWILGDKTTWPEEKQKYFFEPTGENFSWHYAQHSAILLPNGDILCFDNGTNRSKIKEKYIRNKDNYSRAVRYKINTKDMTVRQIWEFGKERGSKFFSQHISNVEYLGEDHYLVHSGGIQYYDGQPAEIVLPPMPDPRAIRESVCCEIIGGEITTELRVDRNFYKGTILSLYREDGANLTMGTAKRLGSHAVTPESAFVPQLPANPERVPIWCKAHVLEESDRLTLMARFDTDSDAKIILQSSDASYTYDIDTAYDKYAPKSCLPYIEPDDRNTSTRINKTGLTGKLKVYVYLNGRYFDTGVIINTDCTS